MTVEELDAKILDLNQQIYALREQVKALTAERDKLFAVEEVKRKVALMSNAERAALVQAVQGGTVESELEVHTP